MKTERPTVRRVLGMVLSLIHIFKKGRKSLVLVDDNALAGHLSRDGQADIGQHGGCDIGQAAALAPVSYTHL